MPIELLLLAGGLTRLPRDRPKTPVQPYPAAIALVVKTAAGESRVGFQPGQKPAADRAVAVLNSGEKPQIRWSVRNLDLKKPVESLVIHFLISRQEAAGQPIPAGLQKGTLADQVLGTTLRVKGANSGNYNTAVYEPGTYLVELELLDAQGNRRQYCAIDLKVEQK